MAVVLTRHNVLSYCLLYIFILNVSSFPSPTPISPHSLSPTGVPEALIGSSWVSAYSDSTTWYCYTGSTWTTAGTYAACVTTDTNQAPLIATACSDMSVVVGISQTSTCGGHGSRSVCVYGTIWSDGNMTSSLINAGCWSSWVGGNWTATHAYFTVSESPATGSSSASAFGPGAIAGTILGGIAGLLAIVGTVLFLLYRRRKKQRQQTEAIEGLRLPSPPSGSPPSRERQLSELSGASPPIQMDTGINHQIFEAGGIRVMANRFPQGPKAMRQDSYEPSSEGSSRNAARDPSTGSSVASYRTAEVARRQSLDLE